MVEIRPVIMEQEKYFPLLQEIEPSGEMVEWNLREGEFYLLEAEREAVCAAVIIPLSDNTGEIKYLATRQDLRGRGYAGLLVNWLCGRYTQTFTAMKAEVSGSRLSFFQKLGFTVCTDDKNPSHTYCLCRELPVGEDRPEGTLRCGQAEIGTPAYQSTLELRQRVMRLPLGLDLYQGDMSREEEFVHFAAMDEKDRAWGVVVADLRPDRTVEVRAAAVDLRIQRPGCGRRLMTMMEDYCRSRGMEEIILHSRKTAAGFYEQLGYTRTPGEFIEVTIPHCEMRKIL